MADIAAGTHEGYVDWERAETVRTIGSEIVPKPQPGARHCFSVEVVDGPPSCVIEIICGVFVRELTCLSAISLETERMKSGAGRDTFPDCRPAVA
jgi:hypothetical protein